METITKADLARRLARDLDVKSTRAKELVDAFFEAMTSSILEGDRIEARGFGVWEVKQTNPKPRARNPRTGEVVYVPARRKVSFKPGRLLKETLSQSTESPPADQPQPDHVAPAAGEEEPTAEM